MRTALLALVLFPALASAQVRQGLIELGGNASLTSVEGSDDRTTVFVFNPRFGYFLTDAVEAGLTARYFKADDSNASGTVGVFAAYHIAPRRARTVPFVGAAVETRFAGLDGPAITSAFGGAKFFFFPGGALTGQAVIRTDFDIATDFGVEAGVSIFL